MQEQTPEALNSYNVNFYYGLRRVLEKIRLKVGTNEVTALGYQASQAARLPATLLGLLPTGPSLNLAPLSG